MKNMKPCSVPGCLLEAHLGPVCDEAHEACSNVLTPDAMTAMALIAAMSVATFDLKEAWFPTDPLHPTLIKETRV